MLLFLFLIYDLHAFDGPQSYLVVPLVAISGAILAWPMRDNQAVRALLMAGGLVLLLWLGQQLFGVLLPFLSRLSACVSVRAAGVRPQTETQGAPLD